MSPDARYRDAASHPHVVIVGAGFAGLACARALGNAPIRVTVIDRHNYHLFVPLLYQVATAALSPADIAQPIRKLLARYPNIEVVMGEVCDSDTERRSVRLTDGSETSYDRLVLAAGSSYNYFGHDNWAAFAPGPRTLVTARDLRGRLLTAFEQAERTADPEAQRALLTTVVIGGGPTGVEIASSIAELARHALARDFRHIDPRSAKILLVEAGPRVLAGFPETLSAYALRTLKTLGVTVLTDTTVDNVSPDSVTFDGHRVPAGTIVWAAGVKASAAAQWLGIESDRAGRIRVGPDLAVPGLDGVYALGDTATLAGPEGKPLPALAQVADQQGRCLGRALKESLLHDTSMRPFHFKNRGNTAIIGRSAAVFDFGRWQLKGRLGWLLWAIVHIYLLCGFDKRLLVTMQWLWRYLTYQRGARLILAGSKPQAGKKPAESVQLTGRDQRGNGT